MDPQELVQVLEEYKKQIEKALEAKTNWGRNDLKLLLTEAKTETLVKVLSK
jgi:hypothetical protein